MCRSFKNIAATAIASAPPPAYSRRMGPPIDDLFATAKQHFLAFEGDAALFVPMDRGAYHRSIFLDRRIDALDGVQRRVPLAPLIDAARDADILRTGWIFHVAHCGSTLLSRLIDRLDYGLVLREPPPLRQLGISAASGAAGDDWSGRLRLAAAMAARRFDPAQPTVIKANVPVNFILPQLLALDPGAPVILLHFALEAYLLAVLGNPNHRVWIDRLTGQIAPVLATRVGLLPSATTAERAAALWLAQMIMFKAVLLDHPDARSLDAEVFFTDPLGVASMAASHLGLPPLLSGADSKLVWSDSKDPTKRFDESDRRARQAERRIALVDEIVVARRWIAASAAARNLPTCLDRPLLGESTFLLR